MAKGRKTGGRNIQKGQVLNPRGPEKLPPIVKAIRYESKETVARLYWDIVNLSKVQLGERLKDPTVSLFEENILRAVLDDMKKNKFSTIERMMERVLGKPNQPIHLEGAVDTSGGVDLTKLTLEELKQYRELMRKAQKVDEA